MNRSFSMLWPQRPRFVVAKQPELPRIFAELPAATTAKLSPETGSFVQRSLLRERSEAICSAIGSAIGVGAAREGDLPIEQAIEQAINQRPSQSQPRSPIKRSAWSAVCGIGLCGLLGLGACSGPIALAPFPSRPDTVTPGSLLGPFDGLVIDQGTNNPVAGALVVGTWAFESAAGIATPEASYTATTQTGSDGAYQLPRLPGGRYQQGLLRRFSLVVYKAGYFGYRSDLRSDDHSPRHDFAQRKNRVRLDRFVAGESHAKHLVFLGASSPVRRAAQAEIVQASLELTESAPGAALAAIEEQAPPTPAVEPAELTLPMRLLTRADVEEWATQAGGKHTYTLAPLPETTSELTAGSEAVHYKAQDSTESWDAALRSWRSSSGAAAKALFTRLRAQIGAPPLRDGAGKPPALVPPARSATPLVGEVPAAAPPLRDAAGKEHALAPPAAPAPGKAEPLVIDEELRVYDAKLRIYKVVALSRRLGVVLQLTCGADLCKTEDGAVRLLTRVLGRL